MLTRDLTQDIAQHGNRYRWQGHHRRRHPHARAWRHSVAVPAALVLFSALVLFPLSGHTTVSIAPPQQQSDAEDELGAAEPRHDPLPKPMTCTTCTDSPSAAQQVARPGPVGPTLARDARERPGPGGLTQRPPSHVSAVVVPTYGPSVGTTTPPQKTPVETTDTVPPTVGHEPSPEASGTADPVPPPPLPEPRESPTAQPSPSVTATPEEEVTVTPDPSTSEPQPLETCEQSGLHVCRDDKYRNFPWSDEWASNDDTDWWRTREQAAQGKDADTR